MYPLSEKLLAFVKDQEGYSPTPYPGPEGGQTIGYGHLNVPLKQVDTYLADALLRQDLYLAQLSAQKHVDYHYGEGTWQTLADNHKDALTELVFNVGTLRKFPKFTRAIIRGNLAKAAAESTRYYRDPTGHLQPLARRNAAFINTFLQG